MHKLRWLSLPISIVATYVAALALLKNIDERVMLRCISATTVGGDFCGQEWFGPVNFIIHCLWSTVLSISLVSLAMVIAPVRKMQVATLIYLLGSLFAVLEASIIFDYQEITSFWPWPKSLWPKAACSILAGGVALWTFAYRSKKLNAA